MEEAARPAVLRAGTCGSNRRRRGPARPTRRLRRTGDPVLASPKCPPEDQPSVALAQQPGQQAPARGDAQPVRCALVPPIQQAAPHQKRAAGRGPRGVEDGDTVPVDWLAPPRIGPKKASAASFHSKVSSWTKAGARKWSNDGAGGARRRCRPLDGGLHLARVYRHARLEQSMAEKAELLPPKFALRLGTLGEQPAEDLEHLRYIEQAWSN